MLRITVEKVPFGNESQKEEIAKIEIANKGTLPNTGETIYKYKGWVNDWGCIKSFGGTVGHWRHEMVLVLLQKLLGQAINFLTQ